MLKRYRDQHHPELDFQIFGSDIDTEAINKAREGLYSKEAVQVIPKDL
jgi:chemotaxis methyl-accepting protein methylase